MGKKRNGCKLCKIKRKQWEEENFFGIECKNHFVPMVVLKRHSSTLTKKEYDELHTLISKYHPKLFLDEVTFQCAEDHWHAHMSRKKV